MDSLKNNLVDVSIVGGGLAGLSLSILLAKAGFTVILFEKESYPYHKVCGEYISMESWKFLTELGLNLEHLNLPKIKRLHISSPEGHLIEHTLDLGGFGISRYKLDHALSLIAISNGVDVRENSKVEEVEFTGELFNVTCNSVVIQSKVVAGTFGKRSNLDIKWSRSFTLKKRVNSTIILE